MLRTSPWSRLASISLRIRSACCSAGLVDSGLLVFSFSVDPAAVALPSLAAISLCNCIKARLCVAHDCGIDGRGVMQCSESIKNERRMVFIIGSRVAFFCSVLVCKRCLGRGHSDVVLNVFRC